MGLLLLILLVVLLFGSAPVYPYSRSWGYRPTGLVGILLIVLLVLVLLNIVPFGYRSGPVVVPVRAPVVVPVG